MGIGVSIFLIAAGAILAFAVDATVEGANLDTIGIILMVVGFFGLLASMLIFGDRTHVRQRETYVRGDGEVVREREYL